MSKRIIAFSLLLFGGLLTLTGLGFTGMFVFEAVIARIGREINHCCFGICPFFSSEYLELLLGSVLAPGESLF
jgi:hypothetical protein